MLNDPRTYGTLPIFLICGLLSSSSVAFMLFRNGYILFSIKTVAPAAAARAAAAEPRARAISSRPLEPRRAAQVPWGMAA